MTRTQIILPFLVILLTLTGCLKQTRTLAPEETITGEATYRERILLPEGATLTITLDEVSDSTTSKRLFSTKQPLSATPPYAFSLTYPTAEVSQYNKYVIYTTIHVGDELRFLGSTPFKPFADTTVPLNIMLHAPEQITSVNPLANLENTYWKLLTIGDTTIKMVANQPQEAFIQLTGTKQIARGFGSCNIFSGSFTTEQNNLKFGPLLSTMKACEDTMETEQLFLAALAETRYFAINGEVMSLYSGSRKSIATLKAVQK